MSTANVYCEEHQFVHNICHLFMDNLFPMYVSLNDANVLGKDIQFHLRKRPPYHDVLFPEVYGMFSKNKVRYTSENSIRQGQMLIKEGASEKQAIFFPPDPDDPDSCGCSKQDCPKHHYIAISNKRFFPYVQGFSDLVLKWANLSPHKATQITVVERTHFRTILNHKALVEELKTIGLPVEEVILENLSLHDQLSLMRRTKVFVAGHGAALTHVMFLPPGSFTLEILPYGYFYERYQKLGIARGEKYLQWVNPDESKAVHVFPRSYVQGIDTSVTAIDDPSIIQKANKTGAELNKTNRLRGWFRDQNTTVDTKEIKKIISDNL